MSFLNNFYGFVILCCLSSTAILAVLIGYPGRVSIEIQPLRSKIMIESETSRCTIIDPTLAIRDRKDG